MGFQELQAALGSVGPFVVLGPLLLAAGVYAVLRWVIVAPGGKATPESISQHALWIGIMGWMGSSLQGVASAGIVRGSPVFPQAPDSLVEIVPALAWPVLAVLAVHAVGQFTYPQPRRVRRVAALSVRRIADFMPRRLAWTTAGIFVATALVVCWIATLPGFEAVPPAHAPPPPGPSNDGAANQNFDPFGRDGRIPGYELAACLGGALFVLAMGTFAILWLIARRRQLETLDIADNDLLRSIAMNRLLRTVATVAGGLLAVATNYAALPDPSQPLPGAWGNYWGFISLAILLVMWAWRPPRLSSLLERHPDRSLAASREAAQPATKLVVSIGAALPLVGVGLPVLVLVISGGYALMALPHVLPALMAGAVLLTISAGEILLQRNYGQAGLPKALPPQPVSPSLFTVAVVSAAAFLAVLAVTIQGDFTAGGILHGPEYRWLGSAIAAAGVAVLAVVPLLLILHRKNCGGNVSGLDAALRGISIYRLVRTVAAFFLAQAGLLLSTESYAWRWIFGLGNPLIPSEAYLSWNPAQLVGAALCAAAVVVVVIPVNSFVGRPQASPTKVAELR